MNCRSRATGRKYIPGDFAEGSTLMTPTAPRETRLADYRPPAYLFDTVDLAFDLDEAATKVRSRLSVRRNPDSVDTGSLLLDGEALTLTRIALDGVELGANRYRIEDG